MRVIRIRPAVIWISAVSLFACSSGGQAPKKDQAQAGPACVFPECLSGDNAIHVVPANATDQQIAAKEPLSYMDVWSIAFGLPTFEKKDEYESTAAFKAKSAKQLNRWRKGDFTPETRLIVGKALDEYDSTYDPDRQLLTVNVPYGSSSAILETKHLSSDEDLGGIRAVRETDSADGLWFVNRSPVTDGKIDGSCQPRYPAVNEQTSVVLPMEPNLAKAVRGSLRVIFVVSFEMPKSVATGEWCFAASKSGPGDAFLIKGGAMQVGTVMSYVNVKLHKVLLVGAGRVLQSKSFA